MGISLRQAILTGCLLSTVLSVNRNDFKTCEQSGFCKRHRAISEPTGYTLALDSVNHNGAVLSAKLQNPENTLALSVQGLKDSTWRISIDERQETAIRKRFVPTLALNGTPEAVAFSSVDVSSTGVTIISGDKQSKIIINSIPFLVNVYNSHDELVAQVNRDGKLKVEEYTTKEEGKEYPEAFWEETFKSFKDSKPFGSSSVGVDISFVGFKTAYGLPEHADSLALRTTVGNTDPYRLYNLDVFEYELNNPMSLYVAIPYILAQKANRAVGALWLNAAETWIDTKSSESSKGIFRNVLDKVTGSGDSIPHFDAHFISESGLVDIFFFVGPTVKDVQRQNAKVTGVTPLPPLFSIAYHQCRWNYNDQKDVAEVNEGFNKWDIPMDVIWLDIEHTDGKKYFTWDKHNFPNPKEMIDNVAKSGRKMITIIDPHIKKDDGYYLYKDAKDQELYVKRADGKTDFEGHCWPGASEYLDFWHPETRAYWKNQFTFARYEGSTPDLFVWNDMNEPSVFSGPEITMDKDSLHYGGIEHREVHNMYGMMYTSATFDGLMARTDGKDRPFILSRSGFVGTQRTAAIWTGDNKADWGHLEITVPMTLSLSLAGVPFVGSDTGGFFGNPDEQLLTRWYFAGAFQPFFRAHAHIDAKRREPWLFSEPTRLAIRKAIRARYALLPYWYLLFQEHTESGLPPMRSVFFEFPEDESFAEEQKQWMVGNALLVRAVVEQDTYKVTVNLPAGPEQSQRWYDWTSGAEFVPGSHYLDVAIDEILVFQRGGTVVPTWQRIRRAAPLMIDDPLTLFVALDEVGNASGSVYLDDGKTHAYQSEQYIKNIYTYKTESATSATFTGNVTGGLYQAKNWVERVVVRGVKSSPKEIQIVRLSDPTQKLSFDYNKTTHELTIHNPAASVTGSFSISLIF